MKKIILAVAVAVVASMAIVSSASAGVERYQLQEATFTVTQPAGAEGQWNNLWMHDYTVKVNPCDGTFTGTGNSPERIRTARTPPTRRSAARSPRTRSVSPRCAAMASSTRLTNAPFGGAVTIATLNVVVPWTIEMKVTKPIFNTTNFKSHGEYVSQGGVDDAAHSCIGMPKNGPADNVAGTMLYNNGTYGWANFTFAGQDGGASTADKGTAFYADKFGHYFAKATSVDVHGPTSATMSLQVTKSTHPMCRSVSSSRSPSTTRRGRATTSRLPAWTSSSWPSSGTSTSTTAKTRLPNGAVHIVPPCCAEPFVGAQQSKDEKGAAWAAPFSLVR